MAKKAEKKIEKKVALKPAAKKTALKRTIFPPTLHLGHVGRSVEVLQDKLIALGYSPDTNGKFGEATAKAVRAFQAKQGIRGDGIVGNNTWSELA